MSPTFFIYLFIYLFTCLFAFVFTYIYLRVSVTTDSSEMNEMNVNVMKAPLKLKCARS